MKGTFSIEQSVSYAWIPVQGVELRVGGIKFQAVCVGTSQEGNPQILYLLTEKYGIVPASTSPSFLWRPPSCGWMKIKGHDANDQAFVAVLIDQHEQGEQVITHLMLSTGTIIPNISGHLYFE
jgi:hypothetical protein